MKNKPKHSEDSSTSCHEATNPRITNTSFHIQQRRNRMAARIQISRINYRQKTNHEATHRLHRRQNTKSNQDPITACQSKIKINDANKMLLFKTALRPIYTYACPVLTTIASCHLKKLQIVQNKILKMIKNLPWHTRTVDLHEMTAVELVTDFMTRLEENFQSSLDV